MLGWLYLGLTTALQGAKAFNEHQPVYLLNTKVPVGTSEVVSRSVAPELAGYFIGDCFDSSSESNHIVTKLVESPLMKDSEPTVLMVENLASSYFEQKLGSPHFYLEKGSTDLLNHRSVKVNVASLKKSLLDSARKLISINARVDEQDHNEEIWQTLKQLPDAHIMLIGSSNSKRLDSDEVRVASARSRSADSSIPFNKIPNFFETEEDCSNLTKECSGRGNCVKVSNGLYSCKCQASVEGDRTFHWGGSDCSKRDVSTQFNLIVGTCIAIVIAAVFSVRLLFNLGSEPLPGILDTSSLMS